MEKQRTPNFPRPRNALLWNTCRGLDQLSPQRTFLYRLWVRSQGQMVSPSLGGKPLLLHSTSIKRSQITLAALTKPHSTTWVSLIIHLHTLSSLAGGRTAGSWKIRSNQQNDVHISGKDHMWSTGNHQSLSSVAGDIKKSNYKREWCCILVSGEKVLSSQLDLFNFFCIDSPEYTT